MLLAYLTLVSVLIFSAHAVPIPVYLRKTIVQTPQLSFCKYEPKSAHELEKIHIKSLSSGGNEHHLNNYIAHTESRERSSDVRNFVKREMQQAINKAQPEQSDKPGLPTLVNENEDVLLFESKELKRAQEIAEDSDLKLKEAELRVKEDTAKLEADNAKIIVDVARLETDKADAQKAALRAHVAHVALEDNNKLMADTRMKYDTVKSMRSVQPEKKAMTVTSQTSAISTDYYSPANEKLKPTKRQYQYAQTISLPTFTKRIINTNSALLNVASSPTVQTATSANPFKLFTLDIGNLEKSTEDSHLFVEQLKLANNLFQLRQDIQ